MALNRRLFLTLAGASTVTATLAACAGGGSGSQGDEGTCTIQFWSNHPGSSKDLEQAMIDAWNKANPDSPAELVTAGSSYEELAQKFNAALSGGDLPDIIVASDVTWFNFALNGQTEALDELWTSEGVDSADFVDSLREDYALEGKHYGMPYSRSTCLMYLNKEMLAKAGLPTDRGPQTWEEFDQWAPALMEASGGKPALVVPDGTDYLDWYFQGMIWSFGGAYSKDWKATFTDEASIKAGTFLQEQVAAGHIAIDADPTTTFSLGNAAGLLQSTGSLAGLAETATFEFITAYLPGPGPSCPTGGAGIALVAGISPERKKKAIKLMDFLTSTQNTITFSQGTGYMPVRTSALEHPDEVAFLDANPNARTAINQLAENTKSQDAARVFVSGGGQRIGGGLDRITLKQEDVATVFAELQEETQKIIDQDITPVLGK